MIAPYFSTDKSQDANGAVLVGAQVTTVTAAASSVAVVHLSLPEWAALVSMFVAVAGFLVQSALAIRIFMKDAEERREERRSAAAERSAAREERSAAREDRRTSGNDRAKIIRAVDGHDNDDV